MLGEGEMLRGVWLNVPECYRPVGECSVSPYPQLDVKGLPFHDIAGNNIWLQIYIWRFYSDTNNDGYLLAFPLIKLTTVHYVGEVLCRLETLEGVIEGNYFGEPLRRTPRLSQTWLRYRTIESKVSQTYARWILIEMPQSTWKLMINSFKRHT